jgi:hypothetical protein
MKKIKKNYYRSQVVINLVIGLTLLLNPKFFSNPSVGISFLIVYTLNSVHTIKEGLKLQSLK